VYVDVVPSGKGGRWGGIWHGRASCWSRTHTQFEPCCIHVDGHSRWLSATGSNGILYHL